MQTGIRFKLFALAFLVTPVALISRLFFWQVIKADELALAGRGQQRRGETLTAKRGSIFAKDGTYLTTSVDSWQIFSALPEMSSSAKVVADLLAPYLIDKDKVDENLSEQDLLLSESVRLQNLLNKDGSWVALKTGIDTEVKEKLEELDIGGIGFDRQESRFYPEASSSAHILGFVGKDDDGSPKGYFGLEGYYDFLLAGKPGFVQREADAKGIPLLFGASQQVDAKQGIDVVTHIDKTVQLIVEKQLSKALTRYQAVSGTVIVMNPKDGGILAMANLPSYDPKKYTEYGNELFRNPAISDTFEPGSIFKPLVAAAGINEDKIKPDTKCDICDQPVKVDKYDIKTWNNEYNAEATITDIIVHSDNVGMVFIGQKLGMDKLYEYYDSYGIDEVTGVDLQGEANARLRERDDWSIVDQAVSTFGQGIAVTPMQMIRAFSVLANNEGKIVTPQIADKVGHDGKYDDIKPVVGEKILDKDTLKDIREILVASVKNGESKWVQAKGFKVAGKTGTAQIAVSGHYDEEKTNASFIGFAPADDPKFVMLVILREPQTSPWASETAAPLWFYIAGELFPYMGIQPEE